MCFVSWQMYLLKNHEVCPAYRLRVSDPAPPALIPFGVPLTATEVPPPEEALAAAAVELAGASEEAAAYVVVDAWSHQLGNSCGH
jgi:hypothetical protein